MIVCACCGSESARRDAGTDAPSWICEPSPISLPTPTEGEPAVAFDVALPGVAIDDYGALGVFEEGSDLRVFAPRTAHLVALDGSTSSSAYLASAPDTVSLRGVARGNGLYGAVMQVSTSGLESRFCVLDSSAGYDESRCASLGAVVPTVAFDGVYFRTYAVLGGQLHRWIFDETATLVDEDDLWVAEHDNYASIAFASATQEVVFTFGTHDAAVACPTINEHHVIAANHTWRSVFPEGIAMDPRETRVRAAGGLTGTLVALYGGNCVAGNTQCLAVPATETVYILSTYRDGALVADHAVPLRRVFDGTLLLSGGSAQIIYTVGPQSIRLSQYSLDGDVEISDLELPFAYTMPGNQVSGTFAGAAMNDGSIAVVYVMDGEFGTETRLAKFGLN